MAVANEWGSVIARHSGETSHGVARRLTPKGSGPAPDGHTTPRASTARAGAHVQRRLRIEYCATHSIAAHDCDDDNAPPTTPGVDQTICRPEGGDMADRDSIRQGDASKDRATTAQRRIPPRNSIPTLWPIPDAIPHRMRRC